MSPDCGKVRSQRGKMRTVRKQSLEEGKVRSERTDSVRRSLFGPVDHEQLRRDLKLKLQQIMEQDTRRWNFNFQAETPLPGRFQWEEIPAAPFYAQRNDAASKPEHGDEPSEEQSARTDQENRSSISNTHQSPAEVTPVRRKRTHSRAAAKPRNDARITETLILLLIFVVKQRNLHHLSQTFTKHLHFILQ
uniref:Cyclin-dependent kinase inhibitor domain-containing protein n=1 Tax=Acanthochromis polyacanthus TaxID=80966 RepID=A0A3Q1H5J5_9TELE